MVQAKSQNRAKPLRSVLSSSNLNPENKQG